jgi:hypothetical protein
MRVSALHPGLELAAKDPPRSAAATIDGLFDEIADVKSASDGLVGDARDRRGFSRRNPGTRCWLLDRRERVLDGDTKCG